MTREPIVKKSGTEQLENVFLIKEPIITDLENGEMIFQNSGIVIRDRISINTKSDNLFANNEFTSHRGNVSSLKFYDMGLASIIGKFNQDFTGKSIKNKMKYEMKRMRIWDSRSRIKKTSDLNLRTALMEMEKLKGKLCLNDAILERSAYLYRKAVFSQLIRGRKINGIVGACMYLACREMGISRTISEISNILQEKRSSISRNIRILIINLELNIGVQDPINDIIKISNNLEIPEITKRKAITILNILKKHELIAGKKPSAVAAAIIYIACMKTGEEKSQLKIAKIAGVSGPTIRNRCNEYIKFVDI